MHINLFSSFSILFLFSFSNSFLIIIIIIIIIFFYFFFFFFFFQLEIVRLRHKKAHLTAEMERVTAVVNKRLGTRAEVPTGTARGLTASGNRPFPLDDDVEGEEKLVYIDCLKRRFV